MDGTGQPVRSMTREDVIAIQTAGKVFTTLVNDLRVQVWTELSERLGIPMPRIQAAWWASGCS